MLSNRYIVQVGWGDCDPLGIVYNPNYFDWFDRSFHALLAKVGFNSRNLLRDFGVDGLPLVETNVKFRAPCTYDEEIVVVSEVLKVHRCAFDLRHNILNGDKLAVEAVETRVCTVVDPATATMKAHPLPEALVLGLTGGCPPPSR
jgi:4-hydroxybenzoyl-CoA thioesterase